MGREWHILFTDLVAVLKFWNNLTVDGLALVTGWSLWGIIVLLPLRGIDRRDLGSGLTYMLFCMGAGVTLVMALPKVFNSTSTSESSLFLLIAMACISGARWVFYKHAKPESETEKDNSL